MNLKKMKIHLLETVCATACLVAVGVVGSDVIAQTPVAHWTFDGGINNFDLTTAADSTANGNDGAWQDTDTLGKGYTAGQVGGALRLNGGEDEFFLVTAITQLDGITPTPLGTPVLGVGVTWSGWINISTDRSGGQYRGVMMTRSATDLGLDGEGEEVVGTDQNYGFAWENIPPSSHIDSRVSGKGLDSPASIVQGQWHHIALVWGNVGNLDPDSGLEDPSQRVYVDGALVGETLDTEVFELTTSGSWALGADPGNTTDRTFDGLLDDLAVFGSALSSADILSIYNDGLAGTNASGVATTDLLLGDVDGSGSVTIDDYNTIRDHLGQNVAARNLGDLDGNRKVDLGDFQEWLDAAPPAVAALALSGVPEPTSVVLVGLGLVACLGARRAGRS